jgi:hypothetical protein
MHIQLIINLVFSLQHPPSSYKSIAGNKRVVLVRIAVIMGSLGSVTGCIIAGIAE